MTKRYLRATTSGVIYEYSDRLAAHRDIEVITEEQAFPKAPVDLKKYTPKVDIKVEKLDTPPNPADTPELIADASREIGNRTRRSK